MNCIWMRKFEIQAQILLSFIFKNFAIINIDLSFSACFIFGIIFAYQLQKTPDSVSSSLKLLEVHFDLLLI